MKNGLKLAAVYTSIVLGAGFASGQELLRYFVSYGAAGIWGIIIAGVIFALTGWAVLEMCRRNEIHSYKALMRNLLGKWPGITVEIITVLFFFVLFTAMLSAGGALLHESFGQPFTVGVLAVAALSALILWFGLKGLIAVNIIIAPVLVAGGIFVGLYSFFNYERPAFLQNIFADSHGWIFAAVIYAAYNIVTGLSVLAASSRLAETRRDSALGGILGGLTLTLLGVVMALPLYLHFADIIDVEIPFLVVVGGYGQVFSLMFVAFMLCAILTTAICNAFAFVEWAAGYTAFSRRKISLALVALSVPAAYIGFSNIVGFVYPLFGLAGLFLIVVVLANFLLKPEISDKFPKHR